MIAGDFTPESISALTPVSQTTFKIHGNWKPNYSSWQTFWFNHILVLLIYGKLQRRTSTVALKGTSPNTTNHKTQQITKHNKSQNTKALTSNGKGEYLPWTRLVWDLSKSGAIKGPQFKHCLIQ